MTLLELVAQHPTATAVIAGIAIAAPALRAVIQLLKDLVQLVGKVVGNAIFVTTKLEDEFTASVISLFLSKTCRHLSLGEEAFDAEPRVLHGATKTIFYRWSARSNILFFYRGAPVVLMPYVHKQNQDDRKPAAIRFFRGTVNMERLVKLASDYYDLYNSERVKSSKGFTVIRVGGGGSDKNTTTRTFEFKAAKAAPSELFRRPVNISVEELTEPVRPSALELLSLTKGTRRLVRDVKHWLRRRDWYEERGLGWRRGYLLYGKPGTGKTSIIRALAEDLDIPICIIDLATMNNTSFNEAWAYVSAWNPRIVLFEDFDTIFNERTNLLPESKLTFDCILNAIQGVERQSGLLLFVTTNNPMAIDTALGRPDPANDGKSTRPGRIDLCIEIEGMDDAGRRKIATRILDKGDPELENLVAAGSNETPAIFTERCQERALAYVWSEVSE
jgi:hypothetical protein